MKPENLASVKFEFDRFLIIYIIPGAIAISPYFFIFLYYNDSIKKFLLSNMGILAIIMIILSMTAGLLLENFGSLWETRYCDPKTNREVHKENTKEYSETWSKYLTLVCNEKEEYIAHGYLRTILLRLKFELSLGFTMLFLFIGLMSMNIIGMFETPCWIFALILALLIYLLFFEAPSSSCILGTTRKLLVDDYISKQERVQQQQQSPQPIEEHKHFYYNRQSWNYWISRRRL